MPLCAHDKPIVVAIIGEPLVQVLIAIPRLEFFGVESSRWLAGIRITADDSGPVCSGMVAV
jgi:hypothetical protein